MRAFSAFLDRRLENVRVQAVVISELEFRAMGPSDNARRKEAFADEILRRHINNEEDGT